MTDGADPTTAVPWMKRDVDSAMVTRRRERIGKHGLAGGAPGISLTSARIVSHSWRAPAVKAAW